MNSYDQGDVARLSTITQVNAVDTDPTTLTLKVITPAGVIKTYTYAASQIVKDSVGHYHRDEPIATTDMAGVWTYRFEATGAVVAAEETQFYVRKASA